MIISSFCYFILTNRFVYNIVAGPREGFTEVFNYQTVCLHIFTGLLYQVSKISTVEFANKYLFNPIGITSHNNYYVKTAE